MATKYAAQPKTWLRNKKLLFVARRVGIELDQVSDDELAYHLLAAWRYIAPPRLKATVDSAMRHALI